MQLREQENDSFDLLMKSLRVGSVVLSLSACSSPSNQADSPVPERGNASSCDDFVRSTCSEPKAEPDCYAKRREELSKAGVKSSSCASAVPVVELISRSSKAEELSATLRLAHDLVISGFDPTEPEFRGALLFRSLRQTPDPDGIWFCFDENETPKGKKGVELWCERADGSRSGPAIRWGAGGEVVYRAKYIDGVPRRVTYEIGVSFDAAEDVLLCPCNGKPLVDSSEDARTVHCANLELVFSGPELKLAEIGVDHGEPSFCDE